MPKIELEDLVEFSRTARVLYVEDDLKLKEETIGVLGIFFDNIDTAADGVDGFEHFQNKKYDLLITGIDMPNMNGIDMIAKIREISKQVTILIISSDKEHFIDSIRLGIDGYILKPVEIKQFTSVLQKTIEKLKNKQELYEYKNLLEKKVDEEIQKRKASEKILIQQSKLAAMGEMMDAVAHQWKQPINIMSMQVDYLQYDYEDGLLDLDKIKEFQANFDKQKDHIINTLNEFRNFLRPNKNMDPFYIKDCIEGVLILIKDEFIKNKIIIESDIQSNFIIRGIENEFKHVILNIINNSKDAFNEGQNQTKNRKIIIRTKNDEFDILQIEDNAGGIPLDIIDNVFKANVTSKDEGKGTGIGLYMSKQIVEKHNADIGVKNITNGALFSVTFYK